MDIKPIETVYNGYRFRSRLEARVAVLFDKINMKYEYEPEGFELEDGTKYLPDFYLPDERLYVEVKAARPNVAKELEKVVRFVKGSDRCVVVISEIPDPSKACIWWYPVFWYKTLNKSVVISRIALEQYDEGESYFITDFAVSYEIENTPMVICDNSFQKRFKDSMLEPKTDAWMYRNEDIGYEILGENRTFLFDAYKTARQARFEHGETPTI